jgi:hypothetical protein
VNVYLGLRTYPGNESKGNFSYRLLMMFFYALLNVLTGEEKNTSAMVSCTSAMRLVSNFLPEAINSWSHFVAVP